MQPIADFDCDIGAMPRITPQLLEKEGLSFPQVYFDWQPMATLALALKAESAASFCCLPFCHTLEAEAVGGEILFDDAGLGPRAGKRICRTADDLLALPTIDFSCGRIAQTLQACCYLRNQGEHVAIMLSGPFTQLNILMDTPLIFKNLRKEPEKMQQVFDRIRNQLVEFAQHALAAGADLIGYSDSIGGLNVLGPKNMAYMAEHFAKPLLEELVPLVLGKAIILLCPKQAFALIATDLAQWVVLPAGEACNYVQACLDAREQGVIFGQTCAKHHAYRVHGTVRALTLTGVPQP